MCYFFKKIKNLLQYTFEKNNLLCKKREKNNLSRGKIPAPPWISNGPSLIAIKNEHSQHNLSTLSISIYGKKTGRYALTVHYVFPLRDSV